MSSPPAASAIVIDESMMEEEKGNIVIAHQTVNTAAAATQNASSSASSSSSSFSSSDALAYTPLPKRIVWSKHPRPDSFGCLLISHMDKNFDMTELNLEATSTYAVKNLRFLLVQRRSTRAFKNLMVEIQEPRTYRKDNGWFQREVGRCTDGELTLLRNSQFDTVWTSLRISVSWKLHFTDCNKATASGNYLMLQDIAAKFRRNAIKQEPNDDENLSKLNYLVPKGQLQTASSIQRTPHMTLELDASDQAGAIREVVEETGISASDFILAPTSHPPLTHSQYPPRKVDIFIAFLLPTSSVHPSIQKEWILPEQAETRKCKWFSLEEIITYFDEARVYPQSYTHHIIFLAIQRYGWMESVKEWQAKLKKEKEKTNSELALASTAQLLSPSPSSSSSSSSSRVPKVVFASSVKRLRKSIQDPAPAVMDSSSQSSNKKAKFEEPIRQSAGASSAAAALKTTPRSIEWIQSSISIQTPDGTKPKQERLLLGEHQLVEWNQTDLYTVMKESFQLEPIEPKNEYHYEIQFDRLAHGLHSYPLRQIIDGSIGEPAKFDAWTKAGFDGQSNSGALRDLPLFWMAPDVDQNCVKRMRTKLENMTNKLQHCDQWLTSNEAPSRFIAHLRASPSVCRDFSSYGPHRLSLKMTSLLKSLAEHWNTTPDQLLFHQLGTFRYQYEHMYTVLIAPSVEVIRTCGGEKAADRLEALQFPLLDFNTSQVLRKDGDSYVWRVRSASCKHLLSRPPVLEAHVWEHLSFACLLRDPELLRIPREELTWSKVSHSLAQTCIPGMKNGGKCWEQTHSSTANEFTKESMRAAGLRVEEESTNTSASSSSAAASSMQM